MTYYTNQLYYGAYYSEYALYHHGIKGQKWGVRRFQNEDGTRTPAGKKRASEKTQGKIDKLQSKIDKSDSNVIMRNTINDNRRGKIAVLKRKQAYQQAKENVKDTRAVYKTDKTFDNKQVLKEAKQTRKSAKTVYKRDKYNNLTRRMIEGSYNRHKESGDNTLRAVLKSTAAGVVTMAAVKGAKKGAAAAARQAGNMAIDALLNTAIKNQQMAHIPKLDSGMITNFKYVVS